MDGVEVARHRGGFTPFAADLSQVPGLGAGDEVSIVVRARDPHDAPQARGKQSTWFRPTHANYHRTTGIWQSVWLEGVPADEPLSAEEAFGPVALLSSFASFDEALARGPQGGERAVQAEYARQSSGNVTVGNIIRSLRRTGEIDWLEWFEGVSHVDALLTQHTEFDRVDQGTRASYRSAIERIARRCDLSETQVAQIAIDHGGVQEVQFGYSQPLQQLGGTS